MKARTSNNKDEVLSLSYRNISISLKVFLSLLFGVLLLGEYLDGISDISDWAVLFFFVIMANDAYVHFRSANGQPLKEWRLSPRIGVTNSNGKRFKLLMNLFFIGLLGTSLILETSVIEVTTRDTIYKLGLMIWSGAFLGVNIYNLAKSFNYQRLVVTNIALIILIGSFALI